MSLLETWISFSWSWVAMREKKQRQKKFAESLCKLSSLKTQAKTWFGFSVNPAHDLFTINNRDTWEMVSRERNTSFLDNLKNLFVMKPVDWNC